MSQFKTGLGECWGKGIASLISTVLNAGFYEFPKFFLNRLGDFHCGEGFSAQIRGLAISFKKSDTGGAIFEMIFQGGRGLRVQGAFKIIAQ